MWRKSLFLIVFVSIASWNISCLNDDDSNFHLTALLIEDVLVPESFELGKTYEIEVDCMLPNGCTYFNGFQVNDPELTTRDIAAIGAVYGQACTEKVELVKEKFRFFVRYDQDYVFRFWAGKDENGNSVFIEKIIPIKKEVENP